MPLGLPLAFRCLELLLELAVVLLLVEERLDLR
jgi:hypothetical protein